MEGSYGTPVRPDTIGQISRSFGPEGLLLVALRALFSLCGATKRHTICRRALAILCRE